MRRDACVGRDPVPLAQHEQVAGNDFFNGNLPLAAAFTVVPIVIMGIYLVIARRLGAFEAM